MKQISIPVLCGVLGSGKTPLLRRWTLRDAAVSTPTESTS